LEKSSVLSQMNLMKSLAENMSATSQDPYLKNGQFSLDFIDVDTALV